MSTRHQTGQIWRAGKSFYGRWYQDEIRNGQVVRVRHSEKLCDYGDAYRNKKDVRPLLQEKLAPLNSGKQGAESTQPLGQYIRDVFLPHAEAHLKVSTAHGYKTIREMYLADQPELAKRPVRDWRTVDIRILLEAVAAKHSIGKATVRHVKALLSTVFTHAINNGVISGDNPVRNAQLPQAEASKPTVAHSFENVMDILATLQAKQREAFVDNAELSRACLQARVAVGLTFFAGLRPGEARGTQWTDYDGETLTVRRSVWGKHTTAPKTAGSVGTVPVEMRLRAMLNELREADGMPADGPILKGPKTGAPLDLHNLAARIIRPTLKAANPPVEWNGFYANRRGLASACVALNVNPVAAQQLLRHSNLATTMAHYIKPAGLDAAAAIEKISDLRSNRQAQVAALPQANAAD